MSIVSDIVTQSSLQTQMAMRGVAVTYSDDDQSGVAMTALVSSEQSSPDDEGRSIVTKTVRIFTDSSQAAYGGLDSVSHNGVFTIDSVEWSVINGEIERKTGYWKVKVKRRQTHEVAAHGYRRRR
jgi:hypothetical protein